MNTKPMKGKGLSPQKFKSPKLQKPTHGFTQMTMSDDDLKDNGEEVGIGNYYLCESQFEIGGVCSEKKAMKDKFSDAITSTTSFQPFEPRPTSPIAKCINLDENFYVCLNAKIHPDIADVISVENHLTIDRQDVPLPCYTVVQAPEGHGTDEKLEVCAPTKEDAHQSILSLLERINYNGSIINIPRFPF